RDKGSGTLSRAAGTVVPDPLSLEIIGEDSIGNCVLIVYCIISTLYCERMENVMTYEEIMIKLEELGSEQTKKIYQNHGVKEPYFGVKIGDLKKLVKYVKKDHDLALKLFESGNHDAMYLAGLSVNPKLMTKETLQNWAQQAYWYMVAEYTVAQVTAESDFALELAREWME